jgi:hypothetical protein
LWELNFDFTQHIEPRLKLNPVALAVVKRDGFNALVFAERLRQTGGRVLTARKQDKGAAVRTLGQGSSCWGVHEDAKNLPVLSLGLRKKFEADAMALPADSRYNLKKLMVFQRS